MDYFAPIWQLSGGLLGVLLGMQLTVLTIKQRRMSIDFGLNWPWEWANRGVFEVWGFGLGFVLFLVIVNFGFEPLLLGFIFGVLAEKFW